LVAGSWYRLPKAGSASRSGGHRIRTCKGLRPAVFKTAALPVRSSPPEHGVSHNANVESSLFGDVHECRMRRCACGVLRTRESLRLPPRISHRRLTSVSTQGHGGLRGRKWRLLEQVAESRGVRHGRGLLYVALGLAAIAQLIRDIRQRGGGGNEEIG